MKKRTCGLCGEEKICRRNQKTRLLICGNCREKARVRDSSKYEHCFECGKRRYVRFRDDSGDPYCSSCYGRNYRHDASKKKQCSACKMIRQPVKRIEGEGVLCKSCRQESKRGVCVDCKKTAVIFALSRCCSCYKKRRRATNPNLGTCKQCGGKEKIIIKEGCCRGCLKFVLRSLNPSSEPA